MSDHVRFNGGGRSFNIESEAHAIIILNDKKQNTLRGLFGKYGVLKSRFLRVFVVLCENGIHLKEGGGDEIRSGVHFYSFLYFGGLACVVCVLPQIRNSLFLSRINISLSQTASIN